MGNDDSRTFAVCTKPRTTHSSIRTNVINARLIHVVILIECQRVIVSPRLLARGQDSACAQRLYSPSCDPGRNAQPLRMRASTLYDLGIDTALKRTCSKALRNHSAVLLESKLAENRYGSLCGGGLMWSTFRYQNCWSV
jgi:hypothetical protein